MAIKVDGAKKKVKTQRDPLFLDEKYTGSEPIWDYERAIEFGDEEFDHHLRKSLAYYNYYYSVKDLRKYLIDWLRKHIGGEYHQLDRLTVDKYARTPDSWTPMTACALVKAHERGMPLRDQHVEYILRTVQRVIDQAMAFEESEVKEEKIKVEVKQPTIQDRMNEIANKHILHFEELEDLLFEGANPAVKAYEYLLAKNVPQALIGKIQTVFASRLAEFREARDGDCEQLKEAYAHLKAADYRRIESFYESLFGDLNSYAQTKKATKKASVRKPPAKEKLVAKLSYCKTDATLKVVSVNPVDIIGAKELWVYNVKTRKLGRYVADSHIGTLGIKGTSIVGFDEVKSTQKTLRKPEVQIKEFMTAGKVELRKFLDAIKTTEIKLNGRVNADTLLLKVI